MARTGHPRLVVREVSAEPTGMVHPVPVLTCATPLAQPVTTLREHHSRLGLVQDAIGRTVGLDDLLTNLLPPGLNPRTGHGLGLGVGLK